MTHQQLHQHATGGRCYGHTPNNDFSTMQIYDHESCMIEYRIIIQFNTPSIPAALVVDVVVAVMAVVLCTVVVVG